MHHSMATFYDGLSPEFTELRIQLIVLLSNLNHCFSRPLCMTHQLKRLYVMLCLQLAEIHMLNIIQLNKWTCRYINSTFALFICRKPALTKQRSWQIFLLQKDLIFFVQVVVKLLVTLIYSFPK